MTYFLFLLCVFLLPLHGVSASKSMRRAAALRAVDDSSPLKPLLQYHWEIQMSLAAIIALSGLILLLFWRALATVPTILLLAVAIVAVLIQSVLSTLPAYVTVKDMRDTQSRRRR